MHILITGASSGLGRALAISHANEKNTLVLMGRNESNLNETKQLCVSKGSTVYSFLGDVTDQRYEELMLTLAEKFTFDLVFANAGMSLLETFQENPLNKIDQIKKIMDTNFLGHVKTLFPLLPGLKVKKGRMVIISSLASLIGLPQDPAYSASKAALTQFFEGLRPVLKRQGISTSIVLPGFIDTPMSQKLKDSKPFCLMDHEAALKINRGIQKNKTLIVFPKRLQLLMSLRHVLPKKILDKILMSSLDRSA